MLLLCKAQAHKLFCKINSLDNAFLPGCSPLGHTSLRTRSGKYVVQLSSPYSGTAVAGWLGRRRGACGATRQNGMLFWRSKRQNRRQEQKRGGGEKCWMGLGAEGPGGSRLTCLLYFDSLKGAGMIGRNRHLEAKLNINEGWWWRSLLGLLQR
jgi:hypothetical protein